MNDSDTPDSHDQSDTVHRGPSGHGSDSSTTTGHSRPRIAKLFGVTITDQFRLPYDTGPVLEQAADHLDKNSPYETPSEVATFAQHQLGIVFPDTAITYAQRKVNAELHSVDLRTLCYLMSGHSEWFRQHSTLTCTCHSLRIHSQRAFVYLGPTSHSTKRRIAAAAQRVRGLPSALRNNRVSQIVVQYLKP